MNKTFLSYPLYIGVEIALGVVVLNKFSGMYGILALFTGHPLDLMQWIFYIWSVFCLVVFIAGLKQVYKPTLLTMSTVTFIFTVDTFIGCLYCLWFTAIWFSQEEPVKPLKSAGSPLGPAHENKLATQKGTSLNNNASQSASAGYEFLFIMLLTLIPQAIRFYFNFIIIAFEQQLLHSGKFTFDQNDIEVNLHNRNVLFRWKYNFEKWCYYLCRRYL